MGDYAPKYNFGQNPTYTAGGTITGGQLVYLSGDGTCAATTAASTNVLGVASRDAVAGDLVTVIGARIQRLTAAAAITRGAALKSAANGRVTTMTIGTDAQNQYLGFALQAAAAAGDVIDVQMAV